MIELSAAVRLNEILIGKQCRDAPVKMSYLPIKRVSMNVNCYIVVKRSASSRTFIHCLSLLRNPPRIAQQLRRPRFLAQSSLF